MPHGEGMATQTQYRMLQLVYRQDRMPLDDTVSCNSGRKVSRAKMDYDLH